MKTQVKVLNSKDGRFDDLIDVSEIGERWVSDFMTFAFCEIERNRERSCESSKLDGRLYLPNISTIFVTYVASGFLF